MSASAAATDGAGRATSALNACRGTTAEISKGGQIGTYQTGRRLTNRWAS